MATAGQDNLYKKVEVMGGVILAAIWDATPPNPELFGERQLGADSLGVSTGLTYHVVGEAGLKSWVPTGATVAQLYGG